MKELLHYWTPHVGYHNLWCARCHEEDWSDAAKGECTGGETGPRNCTGHVWKTNDSGLIDICILCGEERA